MSLGIESHHLIVEESQAAGFSSGTHAARVDFVQAYVAAGFTSNDVNLSETQTFGGVDPASSHAAKIAYVTDAIQSAVDALETEISAIEAPTDVLHNVDAVQIGVIMEKDILDQEGVSKTIYETVSSTTTNVGHNYNVQPYGLYFTAGDIGDGTDALKLTQTGLGQASGTPVNRDVPLVANTRQFRLVGSETGKLYAQSRPNTTTNWTNVAIFGN